MNQEYDDMNDLINVADQENKMEQARVISKARESARFKQFQAQQELAENWNKAITETWGTQENFEQWARENQQDYKELLLQGMTTLAKATHVRARDEQGRFKKESIKKISEQRASGQLGSDEALDQIVRGVLFGPER